jgi:hypothetical protein
MISSVEAASDVGALSPLSGGATVTVQLISL